MSGLGLVAKILSRHWSAQSSHYPGWCPDRPSAGQCAISALALQELVGGEIARVMLDSGDSHYLNVIDSRVVDVTADQFDRLPSYAGRTAVSREALLSDSRTAGRYALFREGLWADLCRPLPAGEVSHVAIRDPNYVAGTAERPEVKVFCQCQGEPNFHPPWETKIHPLGYDVGSSVRMSPALSFSLSR